MRRLIVTTAAALLCLPAAAFAARPVVFGSTLSQPPTDFDPPATCDATGTGTDVGPCTRVAVGYAATGAVANRVVAPVAGTIARVRIRAGGPGIVRVAVVRVQGLDREGGVGRARAASRSAKLFVRGTQRPEAFRVRLPVSRGEYLALEAASFSALRCAGGDVEDLFFQPLAPRRPLQDSFDRDGCTLLVQAAITRANRKARAAANQQIRAAPPNQYLDTDVTIDQGDKVTFSNNDTVQHDVTARDHGSDGKPLFASELASTGETRPVNGTEYLTHGDYSFVCSIHPNMVGTLHVTTDGTPVPRPASGGGGSGAGSSSPADRSAPKVALRILDTRLAAVRKRGALRVRVTVDEASTVRLAARAGSTALGTTTVKLTASGAKAISLKLSRAGRSLVKRRARVAVALTARAADGAGNAATSHAARTLQR